MININKALFDRSKKYLKQADASFNRFLSYKEKTSKMSFDQMQSRLSQIREDFKVLVANVPEETTRSLRQFRRQGKLPDYEQKIFDKVLDVMPEVYSFVNETFYRKSGHYFHDVQIKAAIILAQGQRLVEMKTGEGKTRTFVLPLALYALVGRGAHLATVNDYLSKVGAEYVGHFLSELGISVGVITPQASFRFIKDTELATLKGEEVSAQRQNQSLEIDRMVGLNLLEVEKKQAYSCDITYGTNNEFGFDYLRDNMANSLDRLSQRELYFCIIDEADSILIDEARTPLIISATPSESDTQKYTKFALAVKDLEEERDYIVDHKSHSVSLTEAGIQRVEEILEVANIWDDFSMAYHMENALKAKALFLKGDKYLVKNGEVVIVDEFTGRIMKGRRYSEGLHQAIEAKENVEIKQESKTFATITFQNFFRMYKVICGGSGTVMTESEEFFKIYGLECIEIPTNKPNIRIDHSDRIYKTQAAKFRAVIKDVVENHQKGRPVLIGTASVEKSEILSELLDKEGIKHEVLNAKYHEQEARIVSLAGKKGAVTVATNMAGRGTDIVVGGGNRGDKEWNEVVVLGGLYVIGTERHDSRRIDNQLRGRTGRQGEPGETRFYVSMDDQIMRVLGGEVMARLLNLVKLDEDFPIEIRMLSNQIETAQKRIEGMHFDSRKNVVEYDDVMNQHREVFYTIRQDILITAENSVGKFRENNKIIDLNLPEYENRKGDLSQIVELKKERLVNMMNEKFEKEINHIVDMNTSTLNEKNLKELISDFAKVMPLQVVQEQLEEPENNLADFIYSQIKGKKQDEIRKYFLELTKNIVDSKLKEFGVDVYNLIKVVSLRELDTKWVDHLEIMKDVREGIKLQGYAQKNPLVEYKNQAFGIFGSFIASVDNEIVKRLVRLKKAANQQVPFARNIATNEEKIEDVVTGDREFDIEVKNASKEINSLEAKMQREQESLSTNTSSASSKTKVNSNLKYGRNDKLTVKYSDGTIQKDVKFKKVESDILAGRASIV